MITSGTPDRPGTPAGPADEPRDRHGHVVMMIACCVPMLLVAVVLVAAGVAGGGALLVALACTVMMALMVAGVGHGAGGSAHR